jgi:hypothetical protein
MALQWFIAPQVFDYLLPYSYGDSAGFSPASHFNGALAPTVYARKCSYLHMMMKLFF